IIVRTFIQVFESLDSKTKGFVDFFIDSSTIIKNLRTDTYLHSLSFPARVLAPQTNIPFPLNALIALTDLPEVTS
ncbi:MAG: hypothetical protein ACXWCZ_14215, partial [Flavisolibacter sp.]